MGFVEKKYLQSVALLFLLCVVLFNGHMRFATVF